VSATMMPRGTPRRSRPARVVEYAAQDLAVSLGAGRHAAQDDDTWHGARSKRARAAPQGFSSHALSFFAAVPNGPSW
jgi:hypothetical protein